MHMNPHTLNSSRQNYVIKLCPWTFLLENSGHFLLTKLLLKKMIETANASGVQGRIVNVTSSIHGWFSGDLIRSLEQITTDRR